MPRFKTIEPATAIGRTKELLYGVKQKFGMVPNITRLMANSSHVLEGYLGFSSALASGRLNPQLRERIAIAVANENGCDYCLSAHTAAGRMVGLSQEEVTSAQQGQSFGGREAVALQFGTRLVRERGWVSDEDVNALRQAGFDDGEIVEIIAVTVLNIFTNYFNHVAETEIDFPLVKTAASGSSHQL